MKLTFLKMLKRKKFNTMIILAKKLENAEWLRGK